MSNIALVSKVGNNTEPEGVKKKSIASTGKSHQPEFSASFPALQLVISIPHSGKMVVLLKDYYL